MKINKMNDQMSPFLMSLQKKRKKMFLNILTVY